MPSSLFTTLSLLHLPQSSHLTIEPPESVLTSTMSSPTVRQRGQKDKKPLTSSPTTPKTDADLNGILKDTKLPAVVTSEWDYKLALGLITLMAFVTRFWGIGHPNEVVFDEVHFGKVQRRPCKNSSPRLLCETTILHQQTQYTNDAHY